MSDLKKPSNPVRSTRRVMNVEHLLQCWVNINDYRVPSWEHNVLKLLKASNFWVGKPETQVLLRTNSLLRDHLFMNTYFH